MSHEVWCLAEELNKENLCTQLVLQCSPVIADIKVSNLFMVGLEDMAETKLLTRQMGLRYQVLGLSGSRVVLLIYREERLADYLARTEVRELLQKMDYSETEPIRMVRKFAARYRKYLSGEADFPHEMGLFLGYPAEDVAGYIQNKGRHALYTGYWKVYGHAEEKKRLFRRYEMARESLLRRMKSGCSLIEAAQAV